MKFKAPELEIPADNPFANDALNRRQAVEALTKFVLNLEVPFVIAIDGKWGSGKTTFLRMWQAHIQPHAYALHFNAWESDFSSDPILALISEISLLLEKISGQHKGRAQAALDKIKEYGGALIRAALPTIVQIGTHGLLKIDSDIESALANLFKSQTAKAVSNYEQRKHTLRAFKQALANFVASVQGIDEDASQKPKPVVFFVDELDRCRPAYAVETLERIKHLFDIPGIVFVLAVSKEQLAHSVKQLYGQEMDADGYLRRFFDLEYQLPAPSSGNFHESLYKRFRLDSFFDVREGPLRNEKDDLNSYVPRWCELFELTLREIEKCYTYLAIACTRTSEREYLLPHIISLLIILKMKNTPLFNKWVQQQADFDDILSYIRTLPHGERFLNDPYGGTLEGILLACIHDEKEYASHIDQYETDDSPRATRIRQISGTIRRLYYDSPLKYLAQRISFV